MAPARQPFQLQGHADARLPTRHSGRRIATGRWRPYRILEVPAPPFQSWPALRKCAGPQCECRASTAQSGCWCRPKPNLPHLVLAKYYSP
jgi:hypothetical protein